MKLFTLGVFTKAEFFEGFDFSRSCDNGKKRLNDNVMPYLHLENLIVDDDDRVKNGYTRRNPDGTFSLTRDFNPVNKNILLYIRVRFSPDKVCTIVSDKSNKRIIWSDRQNSQCHSDSKKSMIIMIVPGCQVSVEVSDNQGTKTFYIIRNNEGDLKFQNLSGKPVVGYDVPDDQNEAGVDKKLYIIQKILDPLWRYFTGFPFGHKKKRKLGGVDLKST